MRRELAAVEIAGGALVKIEEIVVVDPFEIEQLQNCFAHAHIGKNRPPGIEHQTLHAFRQSVGQLVFDHAAFAQRRKIIGGLPAAGIGFHAQVIEAFLERLEVRVAVAVVIEADGVEIPQAAIDRHIAAPIIFVAPEGNALARLHGADDVGPAAQQRIEGRVLEGCRVDRVLCQDRHQTEDQRKFAIVGAGKIETHHARIHSLGFDGLGVIGAEIRPASVAQQFPGKNHVIRRHRLAVGEARRRIDA